LALPVIKHGWIPEIRIETIEEPAKLKEIEPANVASGASKSAKASNASNTKESRKQVIIYNEGTPVIIKFGYDRK
jgi:hypothetical protein